MKGVVEEANQPHMTMSAFFRFVRRQFRLNLIGLPVLYLRTPGSGGV